MAKTTTIAPVSYTDFFPEEEPQKPVSYSSFFPGEEEPTAPPEPELPALPKRPVQPTPRPEPLKEARYRAMAELVPKRRDPSVREPMESERRELYALADLASERLGEDKIARRVRRQTVDEEIGKFATRSARAQQAVQQGRLPTRRTERAESDFRLFSDTLAKEAGVAGRPRPSLLETARRGYVGAAKVLARSALEIPSVVTGTIPRALAAPARAIGRPLGRGILEAIPSLVGEGDIGRPEEAAGLTAAMREMAEAPAIQQVAENLGQSAARATQFAALAPIEIPAMLAEHATTLAVKGLRLLGIDDIPLPKEVEETPVWQSGLGLALGVALGVLGRARGAFLQKAAKTADPAAKQALLDTAKRLQQGSAALFAGPALVGAGKDGVDVIRQGGDYATAIAAVAKRLAEGAVSYIGFRVGGWGAAKLRQATARVRSDTEAELRRAGKVTKAAEAEVTKVLPTRIAGEQARIRLLRGRAPAEAKIPPPVAPTPKAPVPEAPVAPTPPAVPKPPPKPALAVPRAIPQPAQKLYAEIARIRKQVGTGKPTLEQGARLRKLGAELTKKPDITPEDLGAAREAGGIRLEAQLRRALAAKKAAEVTRPLEPPTAKPALRRPPTAELGEMIGRGVVGPLRKPTRAEALIARQLGQPPERLVRAAPVVPAPEKKRLLAQPPRVKRATKRYPVTPEQVTSAVKEVRTHTGEKFKAALPKKVGGIRWAATGLQKSYKEHVMELAGEKGVTHDILDTALTRGQLKTTAIAENSSAWLQQRLKARGMSKAALSKASDAWLRDPSALRRKEAPKVKGVKIAGAGVTEAELMVLTALRGDPWAWKQIQGSEGVILGTNYNAKPVKIDSASMRALSKRLTPSQRAIVEDMRSYFRGPLYKEYASHYRQRFGRDPPAFAGYWPIERRHLGEPLLAIRKGDPQFENVSIYQPRIGGKEPFVIRDIFDVFQTHVNRIGASVGKSIPAERALSLVQSPAFRRAIESGKPGSAKIIATLEKAIQAYSGLEGLDPATLEKAAGPWLRRLQTGVLALKPQVMANQTFSLLTATTEVPERYLMSPSNMAKPLGKATLAEMRRWSPMGAARLRGSPHQVLSGFFSGSSTRQFMGGAPGLSESILRGTITRADRWVIGRVWRGVKAQLQAEKGLKGDALLKATARRFEQVVERTQPTWDVLSMPSILREARGRPLLRLFTMFGSQRGKQFNVVMRAADRFQHSGKGVADHAKLAKDLALGVVVPSLMVYGAGAGVRKLYGYKERTWGEHATGALQRIFGNWLVVGDVLGEISEAAISPEAWAKDPRGNIMAGQLKSVIRLVSNIALAARGGKFRDTGASKRRWKALQAAQEAFKLLGSFTGLPTQAIEQVVRPQLRRPTKRPGLQRKPVLRRRARRR